MNNNKKSPPSEDYHVELISSDTKNEENVENAELLNYFSDEKKAGLF